MRNHPARRLAAALVNLLFLLAWGEPVTLRPCAAHDGVAMSASAAAHSAMHHASAQHDAAPMHAMAAEHHGDHQAQPGTHLCTCLGQCCVAAGVLAPTAQAVRWQVVVRRLAAPSFDEPDAPHVATPRLLPFANGPPRTV